MDYLPGASSVITSITPKLFIRDAGTTYVSGEEYNGLWPRYANIGHWKLTEKAGFIGFNARNRGRRDLFFSNISWTVDSLGSSIGYKLPKGGEQFTEPTPYVYAMIGTGGSFNEAVEFDQFLKSDGLPLHHMNYHFNMWVRPQVLPQEGEEQALLYLHHDDAARTTNRVLRFLLGRDVTGLYLAFEIVNAGYTALSRVKSYIAAQEIRTEAVHELGFVLRSPDIVNVGYFSSPDNIELTDPLDLNNPMLEYTFAAAGSQTADSQFDFLVDGNRVSPEIDSANILNWYRGNLELNVNPFIGCETSLPKPVFSAIRADGAQEVRFTNHFSGRIYAAQWNNSSKNPVSLRTQKLHGLRFDIPRGPAWVDFSDQYEYKGKDMLKDLGEISQAIENKGGNFYITLNQVSVRNK